MIGVFVPWSDTSKTAGYIIDGNGCHIWVGDRNNQGYGVIHGGKYRTVSRIRYDREIGPIPPGMILDHYVCNNGPGGCCNPRHCRPVTHRENILRGNGLAAQQAAQTHCKHGHPLESDNLVACKLKRGYRVCKICHNRWSAAAFNKRRSK